jgi:hypothetical protein
MRASWVKSSIQSRANDAILFSIAFPGVPVTLK